MSVDNRNVTDGTAAWVGTRTETILPNWREGRSGRRRLIAPTLPATGVARSDQDRPSPSQQEELDALATRLGETIRVHQDELSEMQEALDQRDARLRAFEFRAFEAIAKQAITDKALNAAVIRAAELYDEVTALQASLSSERTALGNAEDQIVNLRNLLDVAETAVQSITACAQRSRTSLEVTEQLLNRERGAREAAAVQAAEGLDSTRDEAAQRVAYAESALVRAQDSRDALEQQAVGAERALKSLAKNNLDLLQQVERDRQSINRLESGASRLRLTSEEITRQLACVESQRLEGLTRVEEPETRMPTNEPSAGADRFSGPPPAAIEAPGPPRATQHIAPFDAAHPPEIPPRPSNPDRVTPTHARRLQAVADDFRLTGPALIERLAAAGREVTTAEDRYLRGYCARFEKTSRRRPSVRA